jgi:hypothetical protein
MNFFLTYKFVLSRQKCHDPFLCLNWKCHVRFFVISKCWIHLFKILKFNKLPMLSSSIYLASSRLGSEVFGLQGHSFGIIKFGIKTLIGLLIF